MEDQEEHLDKIMSSVSLFEVLIKSSFKYLNIWVKMLEWETCLG